MKKRPAFVIWLLCVLGALALRIADPPVVHAPDRSPVEDEAPATAPLSESR